MASTDEKNLARTNSLSSVASSDAEKSKALGVDPVAAVPAPTAADPAAIGIRAYDADTRLRLSSLLPWSAASRRRKALIDLDAIATKPSVFDDPNSAALYQPPPEYENTHRFDPKARWTVREERGLVRKVDLRIMFWAFLMFFALDLDRGNLSQANADNLLADLKLTTNDFNLGNTLFRLSFLLAELPSQLISKRVGPDVWIPCQMCLWSVVAFSQFWLKGRSTFLACRVLLGLMQGGFIPDVVLYLSFFYTKTELPIRLAWFWFSNYFADIVSAFLATGILQMRGVAGAEGWRWLFLIEGLFTFVIGFTSFFLMPPGPTQTRARWRPKGWFNEREEVIMVNRVLRDDPYKSSMHNRQGLNPKQIFRAICDWGMWPVYAVGLTHMIPVGPPQTYLTLSLRNLGFSTTETNLLTIPSTVIGGGTMLLCAWFSERINSRVLSTVVLQLWALPLLIALYTFDKNTSQWSYFAVVTLVTGFPYVHPIQVSWMSRLSGGVRTRTVSASVYNMCVQAGAIIYANIYRKDDAPLYKRGNRVLIGITCMNIALYAFAFFFYRTINKRRDRIWNSWTKEEQEHYLATTKDEGNKRLDFRFAY
ncbi:MFS general substrate transporter [Exidia glandulosa HHB12029]|uniref:MFS general substrate transporter n=1 Tax=Exidia glandulosa HHB12029 TaxID=1314781 RepID=A0A165L4W2_EXIGL|nr:MFS general substrate transporter [Exidia glandulosa HHB12029]